MDSYVQDSSTQTSLIRQAQRGDSASWSLLVEWAGPLVFFWCRRSGLPREDLEDVFQEIFAKIARNLDRFHLDSPDRSFRGWILTITRNTLVDHARKRAKQIRGTGGSDAYQRLQNLQDVDLSSQDEPRGPLRPLVESIRAEFSERVWNAFWLTAVEGHNATEAAQRLNMSALAVRKAKSRVLARLRCVLAGLFD